VPFDHSGVNLAAPRTVKLSPTLLIWLFHKPCTIRGSGGLVSACPRTHTPRVAFQLGRRAGRFSHRNVKDHPHDPDILSLRQGKGLARHSRLAKTRGLRYLSASLRCHQKSRLASQAPYLSRTKLRGHGPMARGPGGESRWCWR